MEISTQISNAIGLGLLATLREWPRYANASPWSQPANLKFYCHRF
ncbi:hypothetical protein [Moorena sp. SIOASIH]|nr:hypothetical protein [Moorena sp. SIOASIH]